MLDFKESRSLGKNAIVVRKCLKLSLFTIITLFCLGVNGQNRQQIDAESFYVTGKQYADYGYFPDAIRSYKHALKIRPNYSAACYGLGVAYMNVKDTANAITYLKRAINLNGKFADAYYNLWQIYNKKKDFEAARLYLESAAKYNTNYSSVYNAYVKALPKQEVKIKKQEAHERALQQAAENKDEALERQKEINDSLIRVQKSLASAELFCKAGELYLNAKQYQLAREKFTDVLKIMPTSERACVGMAHLCEFENKINEATTYWEKVITVAPHNAVYLASAGSLYMKTGNYTRAQQLLEEAKNRDDKYEDLYKAAMKLSGKKKRATSEASHKPEKTQSDKNALMLQVKKANKLRAVPDETTNSDNTVSEIRQVKAKKIKETKVEHKDSTTTQEKKNNNIKVPTVSDTVAIQAPVVSALPEKLEESVNRFCVGGGLHYRAKEYEDAINSYNNALKIKPYCVEAFCGLAMSYEKLKKYDQAISFFIKAVTFESNNALMFQHLGLSYEAVGRYNEALEAMDKAVQIDPFYKSEYKAMAKRIRKLQK